MDRLKQKEPIRLRIKKLKNGNRSLYLDFYHEGKRYYEYLKLYLIPERSKLDKERNKATMLQAESHKAKRIIEYQQGIYGIVQRSAFNKIMLSDYVDKVASDKFKGKNEKMLQQYGVIANHIRKYGDVSIVSVNRDWIVRFTEYLQGFKSFKGDTLASSSVALYLAKINSAMNFALRDGIINTNPFGRLHEEDKVKSKTAEICYLTMDELKRLIDTPTKNETAKQAFVFCCFTGLRFSDVTTLQWKHIKHGQITKKQVKTGNIVIIPLSDNAKKWLPKQDGCNDEDLVFKNMNQPPAVRHALEMLSKKAGINKKITFHVSRHTAATLWLTYGADLYTVSKLLGHSNISSTQIYAKVIDKVKQQAVANIPDV